MSKCDIIIPVHNAIQWVKLCLTELFAHTEDDVLGQVILVNDNSTNESRALLARVIAEFPRAMLFDNAGRGGFGGACNFGVSKSSAPYFLLLNTDCLVTRGTVRKLVEACEADRGIGLVCPLSNNSPVLTLPLRAGRTYWEMNSMLEKAFEGDALEERVLDACTVVGNCLLVSRRCWDEVGEFDPMWGKGYGEETDLQMRAMDKGYRGTVRVDTYVYHHGGASFRYDPEAIELQKQNLQRFFAEWGAEYRAFADRCATRDPVDVARRKLDALGDVPLRCDVLFVLPGLSQEIGGIHAAVDACNALCRSGIEARCVVLHAELEAVPPNYREPLFFGLLCAENESKWLSSHDLSPRLVVATLFSTVLPAMLYALHRGARLVKFVQGYEFFFENGRVRQDVLSAFDAVDEIWTTSRWLETQTRRHKPDARITRIPLLVDPLVFHPSGEGRAASAPLRVCAVIRSAPDKGQWVLLEVLDLLAEVPGIELTFVAANVAMLPRVWADREGTRVVSLPIDRVRMGEVLRTCDVLIDASFHEGWGLLPHEAISSGVVPVVSDSGGIRDFVHHETSGLVVEAVNRPERYVEAVTRLHEDRALLAKLREGALESANELLAEASAGGIVPAARAALEAALPPSTISREVFVERELVRGVDIRSEAVRLPPRGYFARGRRAVFSFANATKGAPVELTIASSTAAAFAEMHTVAQAPDERDSEGEGAPQSRFETLASKALAALEKANPKAARKLGFVGRRLKGKRARSTLAFADHAMRGVNATVRARRVWKVGRGASTTQLTAPDGGAWAISVHSLGGAYVHGSSSGNSSALVPDLQGGSVALDGLVLLATGRDPILHLDPFDWRRDCVHVLYADVFSSSDTLLQVFFQIEGEETYTEPRSLTRPLVAGENAIIVVLSHPKIAGPLRIDPGDRRGVVCIRSMSVLRIPRSAR